MTTDARPVSQQLRAEPDATELPGRAIASALVLAVPALILMADVGWAYLRGWWPDTNLEPLGVDVLLLWLALIVLALIWSKGRQFLATHLPQVVLLVASCCVGLLVAELSLGAMLAASGDPLHGRRPGFEVVYHPRPDIMRGVGPEAHVHYNDWGVRGSNPPPRNAAYRILCIGGSSTACTYLDDEKTWPQVLSRVLDQADPGHKHWVGNAGMPGYQAPQHLRFANESPVMGEIDCLVVQAGINDFMACMAGPQPAPPAWTRLRLWQLARTGARRYSENSTLVEDTAGDVYLRRRALRASADQSANLPDISGCVAEYADNLRALVVACQNRNLRVVLATQPTLWQDSMNDAERALLWFGQMPDGRYLSVAQLRRGMDRYNEVVRAICRETGAELVDLSELDGDSTAFYDDCHLTEAGARRVAQLVGAGLAKQSAKPAVAESQNP
jgi:lysophospholipase L1-like esterase